MRNGQIQSMSQIVGTAKIDRLPSWMRGSLAAIVAVGAVAFAGFVAPDMVPTSTVPMLFLAAVVVSALAAGRLAVLLAAGLGFLVYDFGFIESRWTLSVAHSEEVIALLTFTGVAIGTGIMAARASEHAARARQQSRRTETLLEFSRLLSTAYGFDAVASAIVSQIARAIGAKTVLLVETGRGNLQLPPRRRSLKGPTQSRSPLPRWHEARRRALARQPHSSRMPAFCLSRSCPPSA